MTRARGRRVMSDKTVDTEFFNVFDGTKGRSPGVYLDMQERIEAEKSRAVAEGREPDLSDLGALGSACSTPVVPEARRVDNSVFSNPSVAFTGEVEVDPVDTLPVSVGNESDVATDETTTETEVVVENQPTPEPTPEPTPVTY